MQSLKTVGVDVQGFKKFDHPFKYPGGLEVITKERIPEIQNIIKSADIVQVIHTALDQSLVPPDVRNYVVHHGGSLYRQAPEILNTFWNSRAKATIIETADLFNLGAKNEYYIPAPIDTGKIYPTHFYDGTRQLRVAHYPSVPVKKGTNIIQDTLNSLKKSFQFEILVSEQLVPWEEQIKRISECDIYIDQFTPMIGNKRCGEYGVSGREAAALGKIVVSTHLGVAEYKKIYGDTKIVVSNTTENLEKNLKWLLSQSPEDICRMQLETRNWIVSKHSYQATGERLKSVYEKILK